MGPDGYAKVDETMQHPRSVLQLLKQHYCRYTPEAVSNICGTPKATFLTVCEIIATTSMPARWAKLPEFKTFFPGISPRNIAASLSCARLSADRLRQYTRGR